MNENKVPPSTPPNNDNQQHNESKEKEPQQQVIVPRLLTVEQQEKQYQDRPYLQKVLTLKLKPHERVFVIVGCNWGGL